MGHFSAESTNHDEGARAQAIHGWREAVAGGTARRITSALASGAAAFRSLNGRLEALAGQDWTVTGVMSRVDAAARGARATVQREASAVLQRLDHVPVTAVAYVLGRSRTAAQAIAGSLERGATRVARRAPEPPRPNGGVPHISAA